MTREIVIASRNTGKIAEIRQILHGVDARFSSLDDFDRIPDIVEDGQTYAENARTKARAVAAATGRWALADDSGLEVDALDGAPGIHSARWSGGGDEANNDRLLERLSSVPDERRTARYRAVIVLAHPDGRILAEAEGACEGRIGRERRGSGGFGYDPLFIVPDLSQTMAEIGADIKNRISHRARALQQLREPLRRLLASEPA